MFLKEQFGMGTMDSCSNSRALTLIETPHLCFQLLAVAQFSVDFRIRRKNLTIQRCFANFEPYRTMCYRSLGSSGRRLHFAGRA